MSFDRLAPVYDLLGDVAFLGALHRSQVGLLPHVGPVERALIVGGGTGRFATALRAGSVVSIDPSTAMCARTRVRVPAADVRVGTLDVLREDETFDLVVTHCVLDLFPQAEAEAFVERLGRALRPQGLWLFSDFADDAPWRRAVVSALYAFFRATCGVRARRLPDFAALFASWEPVVTKRWARGLLQAAVYRRRTT